MKLLLPVSVTVPSETLGAVPVAVTGDQVSAVSAGARVTVTGAKPCVIVLPTGSVPLPPEHPVNV